MGFYVMHRFGDQDEGLPISRIAELLAELDDDPNDSELADVAVIHDSDWSITIARDGEAALEHVEDVDLESRYMHVDRTEALTMLRSLAAGDLDTVFAAPWGTRAD